VISRVSYFYVRLNRKIVEIQELSRDRAQQACIRMRDLGFDRYCAEFSKNELKDLLDPENSDAIRIFPAMADNNDLSMKA